MLLSIESSCDETAVTLFDWQAGKIPHASDIKIELISSQVELHRPYGGVVPEVAARDHISTLPNLIAHAFEKTQTSADVLSAVAVTRGPGLKGCLLVGLTLAKALAYSRNIPLLALNHLEGHLFACELLDECLVPKLPMLALLVSGGHTVLVYVPSFRKYHIVANTRDDAAGEAFDKIATILGLPYPGGPALSQAAEDGSDVAFDFPIGVKDDPSSFSFSGLKTAVLRRAQNLGKGELNKREVVCNMAASAERAIVNSLTHKVALAMKSYNPSSFLLTGGVAANKLLRRELKVICDQSKVRFCVPPPSWCTDNATMMCALATKIMNVDSCRYTSWRGEKNMLGPEVATDIGALSRWPLEDITR